MPKLDVIGLPVRTPVMPARGKISSKHLEKALRLGQRMSSYSRIVSTRFVSPNLHDPRETVVHQYVLAMASLSVKRYADALMHYSLGLSHVVEATRKGEDRQSVFRAFNIDIRLPLENLLGKAR